jgi:hypothetical protein
VSFKEGKFYAIQGKDRQGEWVYLEALNVNDHRAKLRAIAKRAGRPSVGHGWDDDDYIDDRTDRNVKVSDSPFTVKIFESKDMKIIMSNMRHIRANCGGVYVDPNSLRLVVVETSVNVFVPEGESQDEIEMRKFALEKLSEAEKEILKVTHWEVYHKLGDRSMLDDEDEED